MYNFHDDHDFCYRSCCAVIMPNIRNAIIWRVLSNTQQTKEFDYRNSRLTNELMIHFSNVPVIYLNHRYRLSMMLAQLKRIKTNP